ncbi:MAG TPA: hypothetical protein VK078_01445 [Pseudogracilibacillus sp.]|nr:hypothetical protein [Pseudogracilibacillus sp.]
MDSENAMWFSGSLVKAYPVIETKSVLTEMLVHLLVRALVTQLRKTQVLLK